MALSPHGQPGTRLSAGVGGDTGSGTLVADLDGAVVHASAGARDVLGLSTDDLDGTTLIDLCAPEDRGRLIEWTDRLADDAAPEPIRFASARRSGGVAASRAQLSPVAEGSTVIVEVAVGGLDSRPLADRSRSTLADVVDRIERANRNLSASTQRAAADPRTSILRAAESLRDANGDDRRGLPAAARPVESDMLLRLGHLSAVVEESVASSRAGVRVNAHPVDAAALVAEVVEASSRAIGEASAEVVVAPMAPLMADRRQLRDVLTRVLDNALRFRSPRRVLRVEISVEVLEGRRVLIVSDNGRGIDPEDRDRVLGMAERIDPSLRGPGMGLAICRRIAEGHGGEISITDGIDGGVAIRLELPYWDPPGARPESDQTRRADLPTAQD